MIPALIAGAALVLAGLIAAVGQWLVSRNDRQLTLLEVELHKQMPPEAKAVVLELEHVIDHRIHRWYLRTHPIARALRAGWLMAAYAIFFAAIYMLGLYVTDRAALVTRLSANATDFLPVARGLVGVFGVLSALLVLAPVVFSVWPRTRPPDWDPMPRQAPPARTGTQGNGGAPSAKDAAASKQPSTPVQKT